MNIKSNVNFSKTKWKKILLLSVILLGTLFLVGMMLYRTMYFHISADYFFKLPERHTTYYNGAYYTTWASTLDEVSLQGRHYVEAGYMHTSDYSSILGLLGRSHLVDKSGNIYETYYDGSRYMQFDPPVLVLPGSIKAGTSWETNDMFGTICTIIGFESVTVAAGTFEDCLVIETKFTLDGGAIGDVDIVGRDYYAKGVGLVQKTGFVGGTELMSIELIKVVTF